MCQAIPRKVLRVADGQAEIIADGGPVWVAVHDIPDLRTGDYVIVYAGHALERMPSDEAEDVLRLLANLERMAEEAIT